VSGVAGGLFQEMCEDPAQIDGRVVTNISTERIEVGGGDDLINVDPRAAVGGDRRHQRVGGMYVVVGTVAVLSGEPLDNPKVLGMGQMFGQPQQCGATADDRFPGGSVIDPSDLPDEGVTLVLQQGTQRGALVAGQARRLVITHKV